MGPDGQIQPFDWRRIIIGQAPAAFILAGAADLLEATGQMSVLKAPARAPGLSIVPTTQDPEIRDAQPLAPQRWACQVCGTVVTAGDKPADACEHCGHELWTEARLESARGE
jgi:rRNA maturation endonuclease Nob1